MDRFIIESERDGADEDSLREGFLWLIRYATDHGLSTAAVVVPAVRSIRELASAIGGDVAEYAERTRYFTVGGLRIEVFTQKTKPRVDRFEGPVLVPWASAAMARDAEHLEPPAICVTSWARGELDDWKRAHGPTDPRSGAAEQVEEAPAAVRGAVKAISGAPDADITHPMDKARAVTAFKALRLCGVPIDPVLVRALALRHGWGPNAADRLQEMASKFAAGRTVQGGDHLTKTEAKQRVAGFEADPD